MSALQFPPKRKSEPVTVQCLAGHVYTSSDPVLIARSDKRAKDGYLDALILGPAECEECIQELWQRNASYADYDMEF